MMPKVTATRKELDKFLRDMRNGKPNHNAQQTLTRGREILRAMTNTPMTSREAFEKYYKRTENPDANFTRYAPDSYAYKDDAIDEFWYPWDDAWQACEQQNQAEIDALKYDLDGYMKVAHDSATEIVQQAQTIAELETRYEVNTTLLHARTKIMNERAETIAELVKALEYIAETPIHPNIDVVAMYRNVARKAITKVKGTTP